MNSAIVVVLHKGGWANSATSFAYQWQRCAPDGSGCMDIAVPLPCTKILYGGCSYLTRSSIETAQHDEGPRSAFAAAYALAH